MSTQRFSSALILWCALALAGCGDAVVTVDDAGADATAPLPDGGPPDPIELPAMGPISGEDGRGSFRFGVATAATQIEDLNESTDWWALTAPESMGGLETGTFVGDAVRDYTHAIDDVALLEEIHVDSYRFSVEWARVEPTRDTVDEAALTHYSELLDALVASDIRPMITVHHFSNPTWVDDPRRAPETCVAPFPDDEWLCGFGHPEDGPMIVDELREHACLLGMRYGDQVDEWGTINEPVNYLFAAYGAGGVFPPGRDYLLNDFERFMSVVRDALAAHVAIYDALHECDTIDADGDGVAASIELPLSVAQWVHGAALARAARRRARGVPRGRDEVPRLRADVPDGRADRGAAGTQRRRARARDARQREGTRQGRRSCAVRADVVPRNARTVLRRHR